MRGCGRLPPPSRTHNADRTWTRGFLGSRQRATLVKASENVADGLDEASMRFVLFSIVEEAQVSYLFEDPTSNHFPEYVNLPHPITLRVRRPRGAYERLRRPR
mgnify:CR=1 FL=1